MRQSDLYETPPEVFSFWDGIFDFNVDLCAQDTTAKCGKYFTIEDDALTQGWSEYGRVWCNPPYSNPAPWVAKALEEHKKGVLIVMLLPADTSTLWYQSMKCEPTVTLIKPPGRIRFLKDGKRADSPKFGNIVAIFWPTKGKFREGQ